VGGIGGDDEDAFPHPGELDRDRAAAGRLADSDLAADEDPPKRLLLQKVFDGRLQRFEEAVFDHQACFFRHWNSLKIA
jgi:hypothetical protein